MKRTALLLGTAVAGVFGAYCAATAVWLIGGWAEVDLTRGGKAYVGVAYALVALTSFCVTSWLRRATRRVDMS
jgi:hypothetical protein